MRTQYSYQPPSGPNPLEKLAILFVPPYWPLTFLGLFALAMFLSTTGSRYGARILILLFAFPLHELAHALVADRLGDSTPRHHGRITLNPFAQLDLLGSFLIMAFGLGWAYVPINPNALRPNPRLGHMIVAAAGPIANLLIAFVTALIWHILSPALGFVFSQEMLFSLLNTFYFFTIINLALMFFNFIPLAPLDGFFVLRGLLPDQFVYQLDKLQPYSMLILGGIFLLSFLGVPLLGPLIFTPAQTITNLLFLNF